MSTDGKCDKCGQELHWYIAINEQGWRCCSCEAKPGEFAAYGFSPELDRALIEVKVWAITMELAEASFVCISNSSHLDGVVGWVVGRCRALDRYDQTTIGRLVFESDSGHADYWAKVSADILSGDDSRNRCPGGRISQCSTGKGKGEGWTYSCFDKTCPECTRTPTGQDHGA